MSAMGGRSKFGIETFKLEDRRAPWSDGLSKLWLPKYEFVAGAIHFLRGRTCRMRPVVVTARLAEEVMETCQWSSLRNAGLAPIEVNESRQ